MTITTEIIFKYFRQFILISFIVGALFTLAQTVYKIFDPTYLVYFFAIIRRVLYVFDFALDIPTLLTLLGYSFTIIVAYWLFKGLMFVVHFFNEK